ncbi:hypothetical protein FF1_004736 [Malus domestica]
MASRATVHPADHHATENHHTEAAPEIEAKDLDLVLENDNTKATDFDNDDKSEELEADVEEKVFDVMPGRGDDDKSEKGVSKLLAEIEMLDSMIERSTVGLLDLQVMKEEMEAQEREMEWKMSESLALKTAMEELKRKKSEELVGKKKAASGWWRTKWSLPVVALAACAGIVAAVALAGNVKADNRKKNKPNKIKTLSIDIFHKFYAKRSRFVASISFCQSLPQAINFYKEEGSRDMMMEVVDLNEDLYQS